MRKQHHPVRWIVAVLLVVVGAIFVALSLVSHWVNTYVVNSEKFTQIYEDLPADPLFQEVIATNVSSAVEEQIADSLVGTMTSEVTGGLAGLLDHIPGASGLAESVLGTPQELADSISDIVNTEVIHMMRSEGFKPIWRTSLHEVHSQLIGSLEDDQSAVYIDGQPYLALELGPLSAALKQTMIDEGVWFARLIPEITGTIPVIQIHDLPQLQSAYRLLEPADTYVPYVAAVLMALGIALAPKRFLLAGIDGVAVAVTSGIIYFATPGAAGQYFSALGDADTQLLSQRLWDMGTAPLVAAASVSMWVGIGVAFAGFAGALIAAFVIKSHSRTRTLIEEDVQAEVYYQ